MGRFRLVLFPIDGWLTSAADFNAGLAAGAVAAGVGAGMVRFMFVFFVNGRLKSVSNFKTCLGAGESETGCGGGIVGVLVEHRGRAPLQEGAAQPHIEGIIIILAARARGAGADILDRVIAAG